MAKLSLCTAGGLLIVGCFITVLPVVHAQSATSAEEQQKRELFLQAREENRKAVRSGGILPKFLKGSKNAPAPTAAASPAKGIAPSPRNAAPVPVDPPVAPAAEPEAGPADKKGPLAKIVGIFRPDKENDAERERVPQQPQRSAPSTTSAGSATPPPASRPVASAPPPHAQTAPAAKPAPKPEPESNSPRPKPENVASIPAPKPSPGPLPAAASTHSTKPAPRLTPAPAPAPAKTAVPPAVPVIPPSKEIVSKPASPPAAPVIPPSEKIVSTPAPTPSPKKPATPPAAPVTTPSKKIVSAPAPPQPARAPAEKPARALPQTPAPSAVPREIISAARTSVSAPVAEMPALTQTPAEARSAPLSPGATDLPLEPDSLKDAVSFAPTPPPAPAAIAPPPSDPEPAAAAVADLSKISIAADNEAEFDLETGSLIFVGQAVMEAPDFKLEGDRITVRVTESGDGITGAQAVGSVKVSIVSGEKSGAVVGQSAKADFDPGAGSFTLLGWPEVTSQGKREIAEDADTTIILYTDGRVETVGVTKPGIGG